MYKTPARCLLPVGTWWAGLFSARVQTVPWAAANVRAPSPCQGVPPSRSPEEEEEEEEETKEEEEGAGEGGGLNRDPGWCPHMLAAHLLGAWCHASLWGWASEIRKI